MPEVKYATVHVETAVPFFDADLFFAGRIIRNSGFVSDVTLDRDPRNDNPFTGYSITVVVGVPFMQGDSLAAFRATSFARGVIAAVEAQIQARK